jgi:WhiB family transcriptional regulator, redox-sensing transcriptional regulator
MTHADSGWRSRGACLSADPELFFPLSSEGSSIAQLRKAKSICCRCGVRDECLNFALSTQQFHGVWGGTSEDERRRILSRGAAARQHPRSVRGRSRTRIRTGCP